MFGTRKTIMLLVVAVFSIASAGHAQDQQPMKMDMPMESTGWRFMQDGIVFGLFNHQGGPRGGDEFKVPNWWMGMASRKFGSSRFTFNTMLSLDAATVGKKGYREIFQAGEAVDGRPLIDHQHPASGAYRSGRAPDSQSPAVPQASLPSGPSHSCIARQRRTIPSRRSPITSSTRRTSRLG
jgi:hypothetical protein